VHATDHAHAQATPAVPLLLSSGAANVLHPADASELLAQHTSDVQAFFGGRV
jgi:hypothetical protein